MSRSLDGEHRTEQPEPGLYDYARILWRRKVVIVGAAIIVVVVAVGLDSRATRIYKGTASLLLTPSFSQALNAASAGGSRAGSVDAPTAVKVLQSRSTADAAAAILKLPVVPTAIAAQDGTTNVVTVTVHSPDAAFAARVANAYAKAYIAQQQSDAINSLTDASTQISSKISAIDAQIATVQTQIGTITSQEVPVITTSGAPGPALPTPPQAAQLAALTLQQTTLSDQGSAFKQELGQIQVEANLAGGGGRIVSPATLNRIPVSPHTIRDAVVALGTGLALGLGLALLREVLDNRIKGKDDLERVARNLPVMGLIPVHPQRRDPATSMVITLRSPESGAAEAYRTLRTSIQFARLDRSLKTLQVTSPASSEGKTTTLVNLAISLARAGQKVIVVDCDLRNPRVHRFFELEPGPGFTSVMLNELPLSVALRTIPGVDGLQVLTSGPIPPNPSELLSGHRATEMIEALRAECDLVLIDSPPLLPVSDGAVIAARVDATLMVVKDNSTRRKQLNRALELLHHVDATVIGTVLNRVTRKTIGSSSYDYYGYGYGYGYGYKPYKASESEGDKKANGNHKANGKRKRTRAVDPDAKNKVVHGSVTTPRLEEENGKHHGEPSVTPEETEPVLEAPAATPKSEGESGHDQDERSLTVEVLTPVVGATAATPKSEEENGKHHGEPSVTPEETEPVLEAPTATPKSEGESGHDQDERSLTVEVTTPVVEATATTDSAAPMRGETG